MDLPVGIEAGSMVGGGGIGGTLLIWWLRGLGTFKRTVFKRMDEMQEQINNHAVYDAQTYATRNEIASLRDHIDQRFDLLNTNIINVIRDGNRRD